MKKLLSLFILFLLCGCVSIPHSSTTLQEEKKDYVEILSINDTHGQLEDSDNSSISKISAYMKDYEGSIKISVGDMFQGSGLSNLTKGRAMIDVMNAIGIDAMVLGNHEFDWGIDVILSYFDGNKDNGEANFPLLAGNVVDKDGNKLPNSKTYEVFERNGLKTGVIGVIGENLESSITVSSLGGYQFNKTRPVVEAAIKELKELKCDYIVLATHCGTDDNNIYSGLDIDLILNAHTHQKEVAISNKINIPYIQSSCNAKYIGYAKLQNGKVSLLNAVSVKTILNRDKNVDDIVNKYSDEYNKVLEEKVCKLGSSYSKKAFIRYACDVYQNTYNADFAFVNEGGFRTNAWSSGDEISYNMLMEMVPFDNELITVKMSGKLIKSIIDLMVDGKDIFTNSYYDSEKYTLGNEAIVDDKIYNVVAISYIFEKENYPFLSGTEINKTGSYMRDVLYDKMKEDKIILN